MRSCPVLLPLLLLTCVFVAGSTSLDFSDEAGSDDVRDTVLSMRIPTQRGSVSGVDYVVTNIRITDFEVESAHLHNPSETRYQLSLAGVHITLSATAHFSKTVRVWIMQHTFKASAHLTADFTDVGLKQGAEMYMVGDVLKARPTTCSATMREVDIELEGSNFLGRILAGIFNFVKKLFGGTIRDLVAQEICPAIQGELTKYMSKLDVGEMLQKD